MPLIPINTVDENGVHLNDLDLYINDVLVANIDYGDEYDFPCGDTFNMKLQRDLWFGAVELNTPPEVNTQNTTPVLVQVCADAPPPVLPNPYTSDSSYTVNLDGNVYSNVYGTLTPLIAILNDIVTAINVDTPTTFWFAQRVGFGIRITKTQYTANTFNGQTFSISISRTDAGSSGVVLITAGLPDVGCVSIANPAGDTLRYSTIYTQQVYTYDNLITVDSDILVPFRFENNLYIPCCDNWTYANNNANGVLEDGELNPMNIILVTPTFNGVISNFWMVKYPCSNKVCCYEMTNIPMCLFEYNMNYVEGGIEDILLSGRNVCYTYNCYDIYLIQLRVRRCFETSVYTPLFCGCGDSHIINGTFIEDYSNQLVEMERFLPDVSLDIDRTTQCDDLCQDCNSYCRGACYQETATINFSYTLDYVCCDENFGYYELLINNQLYSSGTINENTTISLNYLFNELGKYEIVLDITTCCGKVRRTLVVYCIPCKPYDVDFDWHQDCDCDFDSSKNNVKNCNCVAIGQPIEFIPEYKIPTCGCLPQEIVVNVPIENYLVNEWQNGQFNGGISGHPIFNQTYYNSSSPIPSSALNNIYVNDSNSYFYAGSGVDLFELDSSIYHSNPFSIKVNYPTNPNRANDAFFVPVLFDTTKNFIAGRRYKISQWVRVADYNYVNTVDVNSTGYLNSGVFALYGFAAEKYQRIFFGQLETYDNGNTTYTPITTEWVELIFEFTAAFSFPVDGILLRFNFNYSGSTTSYMPNIYGSDDLEIYYDYFNLDDIQIQENYIDTITTTANVYFVTWKVNGDIVQQQQLTSPNITFEDDRLFYTFMQNGCYDVTLEVSNCAGFCSKTYQVCAGNSVTLSKSDCYEWEITDCGIYRHCTNIPQSTVFGWETLYINDIGYYQLENNIIYYDEINDKYFYFDGVAPYINNVDIYSLSTIHLVDNPYIYYSNNEPTLSCKQFKAVVNLYDTNDVLMDGYPYEVFDYNGQVIHITIYKDGIYRVNFKVFSKNYNELDYNELECQKDFYLIELCGIYKCYEEMFRKLQCATDCECPDQKEIDKLRMNINLFMGQFNMLNLAIGTEFSIYALANSIVLDPMRITNANTIQNQIDAIIKLCNGCGCGCKQVLPKKPYCSTRISGSNVSTTYVIPSNDCGCGK